MLMCHSSFYEDIKTFFTVVKNIIYKAGFIYNLL